jgi:hypothetical protein
MVVDRECLGRNSFLNRRKRQLIQGGRESQISLTVQSKAMRRHSADKTSY